MKRRKRRGISFGTVAMLMITVATVVVCLQIIPMIAGPGSIKLEDAQEVMSAITKDLNLPELKLSDIPIFHSAKESGETLPPAPTMGEMTLSEAAIEPIATPSPTPTPSPAKASFSLNVAGSFLADGDIRSSVYVKESETYDFSHLLSYISDEIVADLSFCTFENLIDESQKLSDVVTCKEALDAVRDAGFDMIALGNESSMDVGLASLSQTIQTAGTQGFVTIGAYDNAEDAKNITFMELGGAKVAFLHYTDAVSTKGKNAIKKENAAFALPRLEVTAIESDIASARAQGAQVVIVSLHWGQNNKSTLAKGQEATAQKIADAGADLILGAHSQAVQPIVFLTGNRKDGTMHQTLVAYSLGALTTSLRGNENVASLLLNLTLTFDPITNRVSFDEISYIPTYFWRYKEDGHYVYTLLPSDREPPQEMSKEQIAVMGRALKKVQDVLKDSVAKQR